MVENFPPSIGLARPVPIVTEGAVFPLLEIEMDATYSFYFIDKFFLYQLSPFGCLY